MSRGSQFRKWAAQVARQAGEEPDAAEAQRLLSIAEYWLQLADTNSDIPVRPGHSHGPVKLFHPSRTTKQFSGWDEIIFLTYEKSQKPTAAILRPLVGRSSILKLIFARSLVA
jgi:hypothetical protein